MPLTIDRLVTSLALSKRLQDLGVKRESVFYWIQKEVDEQARLNGMGASREAALLGKVERLQKEKDEQYQSFQKWKKDYFDEIQEKTSCH